MTDRTRLKVLLMTFLGAGQFGLPRVLAATPDQGDKPGAPGASSSARKVLSGCNITVKAPEQRSWKTPWDPGRARVGGKSPSRVQSVHWANDKERAAADRSDVATPFELVCGSDSRDPSTIALDLVAYGSKASDVRLGPGTYPIVPKADSGKNKPGEFIVGELLIGRAIFAGKSGTLKLERFDAMGAKGSFTVVAQPLLGGKGALQLEGTFDMPCQRGQLQSACQATDSDAPK